jgi:hypothetical protein
MPHVFYISLFQHPLPMYITSQIEVVSVTLLIQTCSVGKNIQGDQKVSVHLMITIQKVTSNVQSVTCQSPDIYQHAELDSHYAICYPQF